MFNLLLVPDTSNKLINFPKSMCAGVAQAARSRSSTKVPAVFSSETLNDQLDSDFLISDFFSYLLI